MENASQNLGTDGDPLARLFGAACTSGLPVMQIYHDGPLEGVNPSAEDSHSSGLPANLRITSEHQWRTFLDSLASEGFVVELSEQHQLQKIWDRAVVSSDAFGRSGKPCLSLEEVLRCVDEMFADDHAKDVVLKIIDAQKGVRQLEALFKAWDIQSFNSTQTRQTTREIRNWLLFGSPSWLTRSLRLQQREQQPLRVCIATSSPCPKALQILHRFEKDHHRTVEHLHKECDRQRKALIVESVRQLMRNSDQQCQDGGGHQQRCNPFLWQINNSGLVEQKVAKDKVRILRYPAKHYASDRKSVRHSFGDGGVEVEDDQWGVSQGLAGRQGIYCRRGIANRNGEEISVTVVVMPKVDLGYLAREQLWTGFLAHRQLAAGRCVMHSLGFSDCDRRETLFYFEHARAWQTASALLSRRRLRERGLLFRHWARCALACLAQISEQSTYSLRRRICTSNLMITEQGTVIRLGGVQWGSEMRGTGEAIETHLQQREAELCLCFADMLEGLLVSDHLSLDHNPSTRPSLMLASILASLRLPPQEREGITLKSLLGHDYFEPLPSEHMESSLGIAWKAFVNQT